MKIIFLDVDGVLNHLETFRLNPHEVPIVLCKDCVARFKTLVHKAQAEVVLSSTWRLYQDTIEELISEGILALACDDWRTKDLYNEGEEAPLRGIEIAEWLSRHPEVDNYIILDDESDMLPEQFSRFVQTSFENGGLTQELADKALALMTAC